MQRSTLVLMAVTAIVATTLACDRGSMSPASPSTVTATGNPATSDGATLKATAPTPLSPINDERLSGETEPTLTAIAATAKYATVALKYRFQVFSDTGELVQDSGLVNGPSFTVAADSLPFDKRFTWRVRAEYQGAFGPWSTTASFLTPNGGYIRGSAVFDPLTNGQTVGKQHGGHFVPGQGWQADTYFDGIDYDIATCSSCKLEFDVTGFGKGLGNPADLKWISMGDGTMFGGFWDFRDHPWKMHLEQRSDGDGTGMKIVWRNGAAGDGDPGDHVIVSPPSKYGGPRWDGSQVYHFVFQWNPSGFTVTIDGEVWFNDGFVGAYAPPHHRISLGCYPRGETMAGTIYRNVKVTPF